MRWLFTVVLEIYTSIKLCELANFGDLNIMRLLIMRFYCQKDSTWNGIYEGSKTRQKKARVLRAAYSALSRHKFVGGTIPYTTHFWTSLLSRLRVSKPHTKGSSALDYIIDSRVTMTTWTLFSAPIYVSSCVHACEPWKWFRVKQLTVSYSCLLSSTRMTSLKAERPRQWVNS